MPKQPSSAQRKRVDALRKLTGEPPSGLRPLVVDDAARPEESDAGDEPLDDAAHGLGSAAGEREGDHHDERAADGDERMRAHAGGLAPQVAVDADRRSDGERESEPQADGGRVHGPAEITPFNSASPR